MHPYFGESCRAMKKAFWVLCFLVCITSTNREPIVEQQLGTSMDAHTRTIYRQKRKAALIGVLTLGLAGLSLVGVGNTWKSNIFEGTSFSQGALALPFKLLSFCLISVIVAVPFFIISFFKLIYYSFKLA